MTTIRNDGAPTRTRAELLAFIAELIGSGPWPAVSADDLREIQVALQLREDRATACVLSMQRTAIDAARSSSIDALRRQGHTETADAYEAAARRVAAIDVDKVVSSVTGREPSIHEQAAFESAARAADFNTIRRDNGDLFHPITQRVHQVWRAAVRWTRAQQGVTRQDLIEAGALRQLLRHNDGSEGFVTAYDADIVNRLIAPKG